MLKVMVEMIDGFHPVCTVLATKLDEIDPEELERLNCEVSYSMLKDHYIANIFIIKGMFRGMLNEMKEDTGAIGIAGKMSRFVRDGAKYTYGRKTYPSENFTEKLDNMASKIEKLMKNIPSRYFNAVAVNYFENGKSGVGYHNDSSNNLETPEIIANVSLGETRTFILKGEESDEGKIPSYKFEMEDGDMVWMGSDVQKFWTHGLLSQPERSRPRMSISFRRTKSKAK